MFSAAGGTEATATALTGERREIRSPEAAEEAAGAALVAVGAARGAGATMVLEEAEAVVVVTMVPAVVTDIEILPHPKSRRSRPVAHRRR